MHKQEHQHRGLKRLHRFVYSKEEGGICTHTAHKSQDQTVKLGSVYDKYLSNCAVLIKHESVLCY